MIARIKIPKVSANVEEVVLTRWLKEEGAAVGKGEAVAELTTDKAAFDLEAPRSGYLRKILAPPKSTLPTGYIIGLLGAPDEPLPDVAAANRACLARLRNMMPTSDDNEKKTESAPKQSGAVRATPAARRIARLKKADLAAVAQWHGGPVVNEEAVLAYLKERT